jgi:hypothetical protein
MPEAVKRKALERILDRGEDVKTHTSERQHAAEAFVLHLEYKDGRSSENIPWMRFVRANLTDHSSHERLTVLFDNCVVEIDGHNLKPIEDALRENKLKGISEMLSQQVTLKRSEGIMEPLVSSIRCYPEIDVAISQMKGEDDDQGRHARRVQR